MYRCMSNNTTIGTIGGTLLSVITVSANTMVATALVAIIGATASFFTSLFLKWLINYIKKKL